MATYTSTSGNYKTTLTVTETATSIPNNTSTLSWSLKVERIGGASSQYGIYNGNQCPWSVSINGSRVGSGTFSYDFRYTGSYNLGSGNNVTVAHNNDGTKTGVAVSGTVDLDNSAYVSVMTASGTIDLTPIPRASDISLSVGSYNVTSSSGNAFTYTITAKSTSFYNRLRYTLGSTNYTGSGSTGSRSGNFTNAELLNSLPTATSGSLTAYVDTATDSGFTNIIGTNSVSIPISINTSYIKPSLTLQNLSVNSSPISGYAVAGYSKVQCGTSSSKWSASGGYGSNAITVTFTTSHGSLAQSSYSASSNSISNYTVTNVLPSSSSNYTLTISATARDSRGATSSASKTYIVYGYTPPTANLTAYRVASSGSTAEDGAGTFAYVAFSGAVSSSVNSQNTLQSVSCSYSGSISGTIAGSTSQTTSRWLSLTDTQTVTFTVTATDKVTSSSSVKTISTASYPLDLYDDGNGTVGVGLGTVAVAGEVRSPLTTRVATNDGNTQLIVGSPNKATGRTYSYVRSGGGSLYFGAGEKDGTWVAWCDVLNQAGSGKEILSVTQNLDVNWYGTFNGNATTASSATNATNATNATYAQYPILMNMSNTDLNTIKTQGVYIGYTGMTNAPQQSIATMEVIRYSGDWLIQRFTCPYSDGTSAKWERTYYGGTTWSSWYRIYKSLDYVYGSNLLGGNTATLSGAKGKYKRLKLYAIVTGGAFTTWEIDANQFSTTAYKHSHATPIYVSDPGDWYLTIIETTVQVSGNDVKITVNFYNKRIGTSGQSTQNNNNNYRIYRIDGIV